MIDPKVSNYFRELAKKNKNRHQFTSEEAKEAGKLSIDRRRRGEKHEEIKEKPVEPSQAS